MKRLLVAFGDSWTFGSELHDPQNSCWPAQVATKLNAKCVNLGTPASSIGHLSVQLLKFINQYSDFKNYQVIFMVGLTAQSRYLSYYNSIDEFVNITTDAVYRTGDIKKTGQPPEDLEQLLQLKDIQYKLIDNKKYSNFLLTQNLLLFQQFAENNNIESIYFSYFDELNINVDSIVDTDRLYKRTITKAITGQEYQVPEIRSHKYFENKLFHPNELGHQAIASLLVDFYDKNTSN